MHGHERAVPKATVTRRAGRKNIPRLSRDRHDLQLETGCSKTGRREPDEPGASIDTGIVPGRGHRRDRTTLGPHVHGRNLDDARKFLKVGLTLLGVVLLTAAWHGGTILNDNFNDGDADGWDQNDFTIGIPGGPGIYHVVNRKYVIESTGPIAVDDPSVGTIESHWVASEDDPRFSNGTHAGDHPCQHRWHHGRLHAPRQRRDGDRL